MVYSLFDYSGQQVFNFNDQYLADASPRLGLVNFSQVLAIVTPLMGISFQALDQKDFYSDYNEAGAVAWRFPTFIGSWLQDFGKLGTVFAVSLLALLTRFSLRSITSKGEFSLSSILCFVVLSQVLLFGVFYYRQYSTTFSQAAVLFIALLFTIFKNPQSTVRLTKFK